MGILELEELIPRQQNRKKVYDTFHKLFTSNSMLEFMKKNNIKQFDDEKLLKTILNLERGIFNSSLQFYYFYENFVDNTWNEVFQAIYLNKALSIYLNLNPFSQIKNINTLLKFFNNEITEFELCNLEAKDLFPEKWAENLEKCGFLNDQSNYQEQINSTEDIKGMFRCGRCKTYKTTYYQLQTRSAKIIGMKSILLITSWLCY
jgi:DNA-directed RNA polymerase subunit M/transcription elongation factor TFIIS